MKIQLVHVVQYTAEYPAGHWLLDMLLNILLAVNIQLVVQYTSEYPAVHRAVADYWICC